MSVLSYNKSNQHWFFKYKLYHIPFWLLYNYIWWVVAVGNPVKAASTIFFTPFAVKFLFYVILQAVAVYFNLYFLIPKYLEKSRFTLYLVYLSITLLFTACLIVPGYYLNAYLSGKTVQEIWGEGSCYVFFFGEALPSVLASTTFAMSIKLAKNWIQTQQRQQVLEKEKLETELNFLKYQFNPHFLFNSINSIFFLIHKNPDMASASLAKFSDLLRHQLYESNDRQIPLSKEISYLENFVELEKLRQNNKLKVDFQVEEHSGHSGIAPFILMTFVENAFKHVSKDDDKPNWIKIKLQSDQHQLLFHVCNSTSPSASKDVVNYGGIGLQNVRRRLDLIYPEQYTLAILDNNNSFEVKLKLNLCEQQQNQISQQMPDLKFAV